jgi:ribosomal protein L40E
MTRKGREAVARGPKSAIDSFVSALRGRGISAESIDSGPVHSAWVAPERAEEARLLAKADRAVRLVSGPQSAYELCFTCGYDHGPGATYCKRCGEYVRA